MKDLVNNLNNNNTAITIICIAALIVFILGIIIFLKKIIKRKKTNKLDEMEGHEFEVFCAQLLKKKGFQEVEITKQSRDYGLDILAEKEGITYGIQCKCYHSPIGIKAIQETYAGKDYYDRMIGVVLTNQYFTTPAVETANKLKILLWDRGYLESMMEEEDNTGF